jgi:hypothetical protein
LVMNGSVISKSGLFLNVPDSLPVVSRGDFISLKLCDVT